VQCGDPNCAPIDTVIALLFANGRRAMTGLPMDFKGVEKAHIAMAMGELNDELLACHNDTPWAAAPRGPEPLRALDSEPRAVQVAVEGVARAIEAAIASLDAADVAAVCAHSMDLLERIEERALAPPPRAPAGGPPRQLDPRTKILAASQKDDVDAVARYLDEGIDVNYCNSLGQTPLHIAAMWGNVATATFLLDEGAATDPVNALGASTPLHVLAASNKNTEKRLECAALLVDRGADALRLDADGLAPYQKVDGGDGDPLRDFLKAAFDKAGR
jgi:hypothetical protein